jgi:hypothetical protein
MTVQGGTTGQTPPTGGHGPAPASPGFPPGPPPPYVGGPPKRRRGMVFGAGVVLALIAVAALVLAIVGLTRNPAAPTPAPSASAASTNTQDADRALCQAIAPLMAESDRVSNAYTSKGDMGTPARDAATPQYVSDTQDWARRIQQVLDAHSAPAEGQAPQPYLVRTLQRFIDDRKLLVADIRPGPGTNTDQEIWSDSMAAYNGPLSTCQRLGVAW